MSTAILLNFTSDVLKCVKESVLPLVGNVDIDGALVAYGKMLCPGNPASPWFAASC